MTISYPERDEGRAVTRRLIEAAAQFTPITAALAHLYGYTHPSQFEQDLERFQREIAEATNDHSERLERLGARINGQIVLDPLALQVAFHTLSMNDTGMMRAVSFESLQEAFPGDTKTALEDAVAELAHHGYVRTTTAMGAAILQYRPTGALFLAFDRVAMDFDTRSDAVEIARIWLDGDPALTNVFQLKEHLSWSGRRLNPALAALEHVFHPRRWSQEIHPTLFTTSVLVTPDERFKLRRIVNDGRVD
ncbi:hypothetical protein EJV46_16145 [Roseococcus sp. SYP-B2431]|uniref:hypothetical protein n=1 Tax=Roseococcus sp. SYP-B2431 TaxID=2496640 RepID=UPI00103B2AB9|nr:hypothetical protein [Roseococcus sp. SYP-B2431]TCH97647.1 hypothetical protein EJV46_16145 [Roseococcus sp. SYP-B2431]